MTKEEATAHADSWAADIQASRDEILKRREAAVSKARAKAGASGVRKGTSSWDARLAGATRDFDLALKELDTEALGLQGYRNNIQNIPSQSQAPGGPESGGPGSGDPDTHTTTNPGAGYSEPTTAGGQMAQGIGIGAAQEMVSTVAGVTGTALGLAAGLGKFAPYAGAGIATLGQAAIDEEAMKDLKEHTIDMIGPQKSTMSNIQGALNIASIPFGLYGPLTTIEDLVGMAQAGTLDDAAWDVYDTVATTFDQGLNPGAKRAGRQMDNQTAENEAQNAASAGSPSSAEHNQGGGISGEQAELGAASEHSTQAGHDQAPGRGGLGGYEGLGIGNPDSYGGGGNSRGPDDPGGYGDPGGFDFGGVDSTGGSASEDGESGGDVGGAQDSGDHY